MGVELDKPTGKHDGSVEGIAYFMCANKHGVFVRPDKVGCVPLFVFWSSLLRIVIIRSCY